MRTAPVLLQRRAPNAYLDFDFRWGRESYWINRRRYTGFTSVPGATSTGGAGFGTVQRNGVWQSVPANAPLIGDGGLGVWEARTNSIRNPVMAGAVVGSPGTLPTHWGVAGAPSGLSLSVASTGQVGGLDYVDFRIAGTPSASSVYGVQTEVGTQVVASSDQTWTGDGFLALVGGSTVNVVKVLHRVRSYTSDGSTTVEASAGVDRKNALTGNLQRFAESVTLANASSARVVTQLLVEFTSGQPIDITIRIAAPNLKQGADINDPPILQTSGLAATRTAVAQRVLNIVPAPAHVLFAEVVLPAQDNANRIFVEISDGTLNNRFDIRRNSANIIYVTNIVGGVAAGGFALSALGAGANTFKVALRTRPNGAAGTVNGSAVVGAPSTIVAPNLHTLSLGQGIGGALLNGLIRRVAILPDMDDAALQALTSFQTPLYMDWRW